MTTPPTDSPYSGCIVTPDTYSGGVAAKICKQFFEVPNRHISKLRLFVKASAGAEILLYDEVHTESWTLKVALGAEKNTVSSIGLYANRDPVTDQAYPAQDVHTNEILKASHFKSFSITWRYGLVQVFNTGDEEPLLTWKGPEDLRIGHVGVRSFGSAASWRVQGDKEFTTVETNDLGGLFQHIKLNGGRLEFEVEGKQDAIIVFAPTTSDEKTAGLVHLALGVSVGAKRCGLYRNGTEIDNYVHDKSVLNRHEFRRFWAEWDCKTFWFGYAGENAHRISYRFAYEKKLEQINYFGLVSGGSQEALWRILNPRTENVVQSLTQGAEPIFEVEDVNLKGVENTSNSEPDHE